MILTLIIVLIIFRWQIGHVRLASSYYHSIGESMSAHLLSELQREAKAKEDELQQARGGTAAHGLTPVDETD